MNEFKTYLKQIFEDDIKKIVVSNLAKKEHNYKKIEIIKTDKYLISQYTQKQVFNQNLTEEELIEFLEKQTQFFKQFDFFSEANQYCLKFSKKNKLFFNKMKNSSAIKVQEGNNRKKNYILNENETIPPLVDIGVFTKEGKVVASMQHKFKQINRFLEIIDDSLKGKTLKNLKLSILDAEKVI